MAESHAKAGIRKPKHCFVLFFPELTKFDPSSKWCSMITGLVEGLGHMGNVSEQGRKEGGRKDRKKQGRTRKTLVKCPHSCSSACWGRGLPPRCFAIRAAHLLINHKEAARTPQAHDAALENSRFHFDVCLKDEKS